MNHDEFEAVVHDTVSQLPNWVRDALHNIEILVQDEPSAEMDPDGQGLLGLYLGMPLTEREAGNAGELPDVIYVFRKPHLSLELPSETLHAEIRKTVIHEIAHYFGIDDAHLDKIGWG